MFGLPYKEVWTLDFEYISEPGDRPIPVCMVAKELISRRLIRLWQDELTGRPPFQVNEQSLFVAYYAPAEMSCFLQLGWPVPARVLDLFTEFRNETNGAALPMGNSLLGALAYHGIRSITSEEKHGWRELIMGGGPWSVGEKAGILDYCQTDVDVLEPLLERMLGHIQSRPRGLGQALLRGRYGIAVARMERDGIPIDVPTLGAIRDKWDDIKLDLIQDIDRKYGVYQGMTFKEGLFAKYLADQGILYAWPLTEKSGMLKTDGETFRDMAKLFPQLGTLQDLRHSLGQMRLNDLRVGADGRNRTMLSPFRAKSSRNLPSSSRYIFGPSKWIRGLIKPAEGRAIAYIDWSAQEVWIAAALSGDAALLDSVMSGDPYLSFAKRAGLAPPDATKESHEPVRDMCKTCVLGVNYGMQYKSLAKRTGTHPIEAREILRKLYRTYPSYTEWAEQATDIGRLRGYTSTVFGFDMRVLLETKSTAVRNYPMQANGAEMLRLACCLVTEMGIMTCGPIHDAIMVEGPEDDIEDIASITQACMAEASAVILNGPEGKTDVTPVRWPDRYMDKRGKEMWEKVTQRL